MSRIRKKSSNRKKKFIISVVAALVVFINMFVFIPKSIAEFNKIDGNNGEWSNPNVILSNTEEAQLMVRVGDIDNFGQRYKIGGIKQEYPFYDKQNTQLDIFTGKETKVHGYPHMPEGDDPVGTDKVMVVSGYQYHKNINCDGYTKQTGRGMKNGYPSNIVEKITLEYKDEISGVKVDNAYIQMFVDDFQPYISNDKAGYVGNNTYKVFLSGEVDGVECIENVPEIEEVINNINQHGPIGKVITFAIPERCLYLVQNGEFSIKFDDDREDLVVQGDGYAIDFVKLLVNLTSFSHEARVSGRVTCKEDGEPIEGARVTAGGLEGWTNYNGQYSIDGVAPGQVVVTASKSGYKLTSETIEKIVAGNHKVVDLEMEKAERPATPIISYTPHENTFEDVRVSIDYPANPSLPVIRQYRIDGGMWKSYIGDFYVSENCRIEAKGTNDDGNDSEIGVENLHNLLRSKVEISVVDVSGVRAQLISNDNNNKRLDKINDSPVQLKGESKANINVIGRDVDYFRYKFIERTTPPSEIPKEGWNEFDLDEDDTEGDVVLDKVGYLNQRAYDVTHLETMDKKSDWQDREKVYAKPFAATETKAATVATSKGAYGKMEDFLDDDGTLKRRWISNSVFVKNMSIGGGYKEASKFWGYLKVPKTGDYKFGLASDDGSKGIITVDDESIVFVDMFKVQSVQKKISDRSLHLQEGKYYPIYLEYFNWGGSAAFKFLYKEGGSGEKTVPSQWLYPSVNIAPGEHASTVFSGTKGIDFPEASGDYYIAYQTGKGEKVSREGIFGAFTVNGKTDIQLEKSIRNGNTAEQGERVELLYKIIPGDIKVRSTFIDNGKYLSNIKIENIRIQDTMPEGITMYLPPNEEGQKIKYHQNGRDIEINLSDITYTLDNEEKVYKAEPLIEKLTIGSGIQGDYTISEEGAAIATFTDVNGSMRQMNFESVGLNVIERSTAIEAIERDFGEGIPAEEEFTIVYEPVGETIFNYSGYDHVDFTEFEYSETFPPRVELVSYPSTLTKTGTYEMGYTLSGGIDSIRLDRIQNSRYEVQGTFEIVVKAQYPGIYEFQRGKCVYSSGNYSGEAIAEAGELNVIGKRLPDIRILEIQPGRDFELNEESFKSLVKEGGNIRIDRMSVAEFNNSIAEVNGLYDIVYIGKKSGEYTTKGEKVSNLPQGSDPTCAEYYPGVDITDRNAKLIKDYISTGQLTIFKDNLFSNTETKIYSNFYDFREDENIISLHEIEELDGKLKEKFDLCSKRPILEVISSPMEYIGSEGSYSHNHNMNFIFDIENLNMIDFNENIMNVRLLLDENGDGFFREDEVAEVGQPKLNGDGYSLNHDIKEYFTGIMPWKLEISDSKNGAKTYALGYPAYKGEKLNVRVLHLVPDKGTNLSMTTGTQFKPDLSTEIYNIDITELKIGDFQDNYPNPVVVNGEKIETDLNGNYDMIILGFFDMYNGSDLKKPKAIQAVKEFIKTEQSVMFTHDTFMYYVNDQNSATADLTKEFRDIAGQSRYLDPNNPSELNLFENKIPHDVLPEEGKKTYGFTVQAFERAKGNGFPRYSDTFRLNESIITKYPYVLGEILPVAQTHYQYFQLNLEDPDVVAWYTYETGDERKYDGRNNYYTYSKGNITYSGTGHSAPNGVQEQRLFVNTMLKASRNANHAPTLEVRNIEEGKLYSRNSKGIEFSFIPTDIDGDDLLGKVSINDSIVEDYSNGELISKEPMFVEISRGVIKEAIGDSEEFVVSIEVWDSKGAVVEYRCRVQYKDIPVIEMSSSSKSGYLTGDKGSYTLKIQSIRALNDVNTEIKDIEHTMDYSKERIHNISDTKWENILDVVFNPDPEPQEQSKYFGFNLVKAGNSTISNKLEYKYNNIKDVPQESSYDYTVAVREGSIKVKVQDNDGTNYGVAHVKVEYPDGSESVLDTNSYGQLTLDGLRTGTYVLSLKNIKSNHIISGNSTKTVKLDYSNNSENVYFNVVDKGYAALSFRAEADKKFLVGDKGNIRLFINAYNSSANVHTEMRNFEHTMDYDNSAMNFINYTPWNISTITIDGSNITNGSQIKDYDFTFNRAGDYTIINSVKYTYFGGINRIANYENDFSVRAGRIEVQVEKPDTRLCKGIHVFVKDKNSGELIADGVTDENSGIFTVVNVPTGEYEISIPDIYEFTNSGVYKQDVRVSYDNYIGKVNFKIDTDSVIVRSGMFVNNRFLKVNEVPEGFRAPVATEFKVLHKEPAIKIEVDDRVQGISFELYKYNDYGLLVPVEEDITIKVEGLEGERTISKGSGDIDISGLSGDRKMTLTMPKSETYYNHYVLVHDIHQNGGVREEINYLLNVNTTPGNEKTLKIVELPSLD